MVKVGIEIRVGWILSVLLFSVIANVVNFKFAFAQDYPTQIHLTFLTNPSYNMVVTWKTNTNTPSIVKYGLSPGSLNQTATGMAMPSPLQTSGWIHDVSLTGLTPNTKYYYTCGDGMVWSPVKSFRTAPNFHSDVKIAMFGDMGTLSPAQDTADQLATKDFDLALFSGDLARAEGFQFIWDQWFLMIEPFASRAPFMPCLGNHEIEEVMGQPVGAEAYLGRFALPGNEHYYSFDWGSIHITVIDTEIQDYDPESDQYAWIEADLNQTSKREDILWRFVMFHRPPYSSGIYHGSHQGVRDTLTPLFDAYDVDLVINGHEHNYERTYPLLYEENVTDFSETTYQNPEGPIYLITGGAGAPLYPFGLSKPEWSAARDSTYHFCIATLEANKNKLTVQSYRSEDGSMLDYFIILKPLPTNTPTPVPTYTLTPIPTDLPTSTPTPSRTPLPTSTPTPSWTPIPTRTPTVTPSGGITSTPTPHHTYQPGAPPVIRLAGYKDSYLTTREGGFLSLIAWVVDIDVRRVQLYFGGMPTGIFLYDDGQHGDFGFGDGIYGLQASIGPSGASAKFLLEIQAEDSLYKKSKIWPFLEVPEEPTLTPTPSPTPTPLPPKWSWLCKWAIDPDTTSYCDDISMTNCSDTMFKCEYKKANFIVKIGYAKAGDEFRFEWLKNNEVYLAQSDITFEDCTTQSFLSVLEITSEVRAACRDNWAVRFFYANQEVFYQPFSLECDCDKR